MALVLLILYFLPLLALALPVVIAGKSVARWTILDIPPFFIPAGVWVGLTHLAFKTKTLSNLIDLPVLAVVVTIAAVLRVQFAKKASVKAAVGIFWLAATIAAPVVYFGMPTLSE